MKRHDAASYARSAVAVVALSTALSGCYYYVPYGYVPYDAVPTEATQPYPFKMPEEATSGTVSDSTASNTYVATAAPVFIGPAYYPAPYPYYAWPWWGPSVSLSFGYWGGCCYGGGHHGHWGHGGWGHGGWGHGNRGWSGQSGWTGHGYRWRGGGGGWGGGGGGHYWGGAGGHGPVH